MSVLHKLVLEENNLDRILELLGTGENPNTLDEDGNTPLHIASFKVTASPQDLEENLQVARELINFGAQVDMKNRYGYAPLHLAVSSRKLEMVQCLLQASAQINIQSHRMETPLALAAESAHFESVEELLKQEASVNLLDFLGNSVMHYVLEQPTVNVKAVVELLRHGCELNVRNKFHMTPLDLYLHNLANAPSSEVFKASYLLKLFLFQCNVFKNEQLKLIKFIDQKNECNLHRFYKHYGEEIFQTKNDFLAPDCTVYDIAVSGFNYSVSKIYKHIPFHIYDQLLDRLINNKYPVYHDIIVSGICTNYMKKKFADKFNCVRNNREFLNFDALYLISSYLSHLDMLNMMIACSSR